MWSCWRGWWRGRCRAKGRQRQQPTANDFSLAPSSKQSEQPAVSLITSNNCRRPRVWARSVVPAKHYIKIFFLGAVYLCPFLFVLQSKNCFAQNKTSENAVSSEGSIFKAATVVSNAND